MTNPNKDPWYGTRLAVGGFASMLLLSLIILFCAIAGHAQDAGKRVVFRNVFSAITTAQTSGPLPNIGQSMHLISVIFPAESATATGLQVRIEASYDGSQYFAISKDITSATNVGGIVYQFTSAYGVYPFVRVRSINTTGGKLMDVHYSGHTLPVVPFLEKQSDRFIL